MSYSSGYKNKRLVSYKVRTDLKTEFEQPVHPIYEEFMEEFSYHNPLMNSVHDH